MYRVLAGGIQGFWLWVFTGFPSKTLFPFGGSKVLDKPGHTPKKPSALKPVLLGILVKRGL